METKFVVEEVGLIEAWVKRVEMYLEKELRDKLSSRKLKEILNADDVASSTWKKVVRRASDQSTTWRLNGGSLVRQTAKSFGFVEAA